MTGRPPTSSSSARSSAEYLREARRIRARNLSPAARQAALKALAPVPNQATRPRVLTQPSFTVPILSVPPATAETFAAEVTQQIAGGVLRYTARRQLLARAARLKIPPFEANLLIASVLHAKRPKVTPPAADREISAFHVAATITLLTTMLAIALFA